MREGCTSPPPLFAFMLCSFFNVSPRTLPLTSNHLLHPTLPHGQLQVSFHMARPPPREPVNTSSPPLIHPPQVLDVKLPFSEAQVITDSMAYLLRSLRVDDIKVRHGGKAQQRKVVGIGVLALGAGDIKVRQGGEKQHRGR